MISLHENKPLRYLRFQRQSAPTDSGFGDCVFIDIAGTEKEKKKKKHLTGLFP